MTKTLKTKSILSTLIVFFSILLIPSQTANGAVMSPCPKSKLGKIVNGSVCKKVGIFYRWVKIQESTPVKLPDPTPSVTPAVSATPTPTPTIEKITYKYPNQPSENIDLCKIKDLTTSRQDLFTGFPVMQPWTQRSGTVKWALIPIDFADSPGENNFKVRVTEQMQLLSEWYSMVSYGKIKIEWVVADDWIRLSGKSADWSNNKSGTANRPDVVKFWSKAIADVDPHFDFTGIQVANFILPKNQTFMLEGTQTFPFEDFMKQLKTDEGKLASLTIIGKYFEDPNRPYWSYWAHEFGHAIALPHIGSSYKSNSFSSLDIMASQDGVTRDLSGWLRFISGWMDDNKVYCQSFSNLSELDLSLVPLNNADDGYKMAVIPLSDGKGLIIESRRHTKYACEVSRNQDGVLVYIYDPRMNYLDESGFLTPVYPSSRNIVDNSCGIQRTPDQLLHPGDVVKIGNIVIQVINSGQYDTVKIIKQ